MAAGCAIVASDLPAFIAVAGGVASHFPVGDRRRLADLLATILDDDGIQRRMSSDARSRAEEFDWGRVLPRWIELYEGALERGHR